MKRRETLKHLGLSIGSMLTLPAWANHWQGNSLAINGLQMSLANEMLLAEIVETIIPTTDTVGAKSLGVHLFIQKIVVDCLDKPSRELFQQGLGMIDEQMQKRYSKSFVDSNPEQRLEILQKLESEKDNELGKFYKLLKGLTIQGYLTSEYVMVNHYDYKMIPNKFEPCAVVGN
jgi:hypothetical protein